MLRNGPLEVSKYRSVGQLPLLLSTQRLSLYSQKLVGELAAFFLPTLVKCPDCPVCSCCFYCPLLLAPILPGMSDPPEKTTHQEKASEDRWNSLKRRADIVKPEVSRFILYGILP